MSDDHAWHALRDDPVGTGRARPRPGPSPSETSEVLVEAALSVLGAARSVLDLADRRLQARRAATVIPAEQATPAPGPAQVAPPPMPPPPRSAASARHQIELTY